MSLITVNGSLAGGPLKRGNFGSPPPAVEQERITYTYGHSLWFHNQDFGSVARWMSLMVTAAADSKAFENEFTFFTVPAATPPSDNVQTLPGVTQPTPRGPYATWTAADSAGFTDVVSFVDNFAVGPIRGDMETDPRIAVPAASPVNMVQHYVNAFGGWESGSSQTDLNYWIYEVWGDAGSMNNPKPINPDGTANSAALFQRYREETTTTFGHTQFFDDCLADVRSDLPAFSSRINLIPACRVLISTMELPILLSNMVAGDWFEDDAPHGRDSCYCIVGAIVYSSFYQEAAPQPNFSGTAVTSVIQNNWTAIANHINTEVNG